MSAVVIIHPAHAAARRTLVADVLALLASADTPWTADDLETLDDVGWALIASNLGRTQPIGLDTREVCVDALDALERARRLADPFAGLDGDAS